MAILLILWTLQQMPETIYALRSSWAWGNLHAGTEWLRAARVLRELRQGQARRSDGAWFVRRAFAACTLFCVISIWWAVASALSAFHSLLWAMPTVILATGFWSYMLADSRALEEKFGGEAI